MSLTINIESRGLKEAQAMLKGTKDGFERAMSKSINSSLKAGNTEAAQLIRKRYNLKSPTIKKGFFVRKATDAHLKGELKAKGSMFPLSEFNPSVKLKKGGKNKRTHQYVYAAIVRGKQKLIKGAFAPHGAFHGVLERRQPERMPVFPVLVIGTPLMVSSLEIKPQIEERMRQAYDTALKYNVDFYLDKEIAKSRKFKA